MQFEYRFTALGLTADGKLEACHNRESRKEVIDAVTETVRQDNRRYQYVRVFILDRESATMGIRSGVTALFQGTPPPPITWETK